MNSTQSKLHVGWTAGGGVEYAINDRWSFATEYLYVDLGYKNYVVNFSGGEVMNVSLGQKFNSVRAVLNYRI